MKVKKLRDVLRASAKLYGEAGDDATSQAITRLAQALKNADKLAVNDLNMRIKELRREST